MNDAALDLLYALRLEDGRRWGEAATDFQRADSEAVLNGDCPNHYLTRPRGDSKTGDLGGMNIAVGLAQAPPRARMYALAADEKQGRLLIDAIAGFAERTPELRGALTIHESRVVFPRADVRLDVLAADQASIWGLRPFFTTVDELAQWHTTTPPQRCFEAVSSAAVKVAGSRLVVLTTAGEPGHWSRGVLDHALADPLWRVNEVPGPSHWLDPDRLEGERRRLPESSYRRLFLNEWASGEDRLASEDDLAACTVLDGPLDPQPGVRYVLGLDVGLTSDRTVAAVCHAEKQPGSEGVRVVLDRMQTWKGSRLRPVQLSAVEEWVEEAARRYGRARVRFDPYQAVHLSQRLKRRGLTVEEFTFSAASVGKLAITLLTLIRGRQLALPDDADLLDELRHVRLRESSPGVYRLDHDRNRHDDRAVALALAASFLVDHAASAQPIRTSRVRRPLASPGAARLGVTAHDPVARALGTDRVYSADSIAAAERRMLGPSWGRRRRRPR